MHGAAYSFSLYTGMDYKSKMKPFSIDLGRICEMRNIAIITGATGGLGKTFTKHLIDHVDEVWAIGRNIDKLKSLEELHGEKIKSFSVDLSNIDNLDCLKNELSKKEYSVKYLINNAGTGRMAQSTDFTDMEIQSHINTHNTAVASGHNVIPVLC